MTLRERKKVATRQALYEAALRLAVDRGLDLVTVEAIADEANVSRRTFSNYFANKEDALVYGDQVRSEAFLLALRDRPAAEPPWQALTAAARRHYGALDTVDPKWLSQLHLVRRHPSLLAQQVAVHTALERDLAAEISRRSTGAPDELRSRVIAATFLATLRTVFNLWAERDGPQSLSDAIVAGLDCAGARLD